MTYILEYLDLEFGALPVHLLNAIFGSRRPPAAARGMGWNMPLPAASALNRGPRGSNQQGKPI